MEARTLLLGVLIGVAGATLARCWMDDEGHAKPAASSSPAAAARASTAAGPNETTRAWALVAGTSALAGAGGASKPSTPNTPAEPAPGLQKSAPATTGHPTSPAQPAVVASAPAAQTTLPELTPEHRRLAGLDSSTSDPARPRTMAEVVKGFGDEATDAAWATTMQANIQAYMQGRTQAAGLELMSVACRATLCMLQAVGHEGNQLQTWNDIVGAMFSEPWAEFSGNHTSGSSANDRQTILTVLSRKKF